MTMAADPTDRPAPLAELATDYARTRDPAALQRLRHAVRHADNFDPGLDIVRTTAPLLERGAHAEVVEAIRAVMPGGFFSPAAHSALAVAHEALGDAVRARREQRTARLALEAILGSGDGSADRPWQVLRVSDEYDVLQAQGRRSRAQRLVTRDGRDLDQHRCEDGSQAWFAIGTGEWNGSSSSTVAPA